jgi:two-component system, cell cycle sensor histidine kinase and response regulator CckA
LQTILLVEDEVSFRELLAHALGSWGYNVLTAQDGRAAFVILRSHPGIIDLVLSDLILPFWSGWELARESTYVRPTTKFLMMSGYPDQPSSPFGQLSNWLFIRKPFQLGELRNLIKDMLPLMRRDNSE